MMKSIIISLLATLFILTSCSRTHLEEIKPGETTITEAIDLLGEPVDVRPSSFNENDEMFKFEVATIQVEKKQVKAVFRNPENEEEEILQYWRQLYKDKHNTWNAVRAPSSVGLWELKYPEEGVAIIYNSNTSKVVRIINYEPKR